MKQVNICKSSDEYINIFDGRDSKNNNLKNMCFQKKVEKKSIHEIVNICKID